MSWLPSDKHHYNVNPKLLSVIRVLGLVKSPRESRLFWRSCKWWESSWVRTAVTKKNPPKKKKNQKTCAASPDESCRVCRQSKPMISSLKLEAKRRHPERLFRDDEIEAKAKACRGPGAPAVSALTGGSTNGRIRARQSSLTRFRPSTEGWRRRKESKKERSHKR